jgi:hypothetical protein
MTVLRAFIQFGHQSASAAKLTNLHSEIGRGQGFEGRLVGRRQVKAVIPPVAV